MSADHDSGPTLARIVIGFVTAACVSLILTAAAGWGPVAAIAVGALAGALAAWLGYRLMRSIADAADDLP